MGQKTNPNILRLGITKNWKTEFFEKKKKELPLYIFKDLEIQSYVERFFKSKGVFIHDYSQYYNNHSLHLYVSYFISSKNTFHIFNKNISLINSKGITKSISFDKKNTLIFNENVKTSQNMVSFELENFSNNLYRIKNYLNSGKSNNAIFQLVSNNSLTEMLKVISEFTSNKLDVTIHCSCINKDFNHFNLLKSKKVRMLQKFKSTPFFKVGLELLFHVAFNKNSARLLSEFLSLQLRLIKRPNFFLAFIKQTLTILISSKLSILKGVKIMLKGRLTKGPRAKHKIICIGEVPVQSFNSDMDYFQTTTHNANGSYGIKVWIVAK